MSLTVPHIRHERMSTATPRTVIAGEHGPSVAAELAIARRAGGGLIWEAGAVFREAERGSYACLVVLRLSRSRSR